MRFDIKEFLNVIKDSGALINFLGKNNIKLSKDLIEYILLLNKNNDIIESSNKSYHRELLRIMAVGSTAEINEFIKSYNILDNLDNLSVKKIKWNRLKNCYLSQLYYYFFEEKLYIKYLFGDKSFNYTYIIFSNKKNKQKIFEITFINNNIIAFLKFCLILY